MGDVIGRLPGLDAGLGLPRVPRPRHVASEVTFADDGTVSVAAPTVNYPTMP